MLERLIQAALITFLLHLTAGLNTSTRIPAKGVSSMSELPASFIGSTIHLLK